MVNFAYWNEAGHGQDCRDERNIRTCNVITAKNAEEIPGLAVDGPSFRKPKVGPELALVEEYVQTQLPPAPRGQLKTVFLEPEIESGFPDAVVVYWHVATARRWSHARAELTKVDVRVAHFLATAGACDLDILRTFFNRNVVRSLDRLRDADIIRGTAKTWRLRSIREVFAVQRLVAIEAKMDQWRGGLHQAVLNTWFASESYLLLPRVPSGANLVAEAQRLGVGVRTRDQHLDGTDWLARRDRIPKSYASWLFNEWAWRARFFM